MYGQAVGAVVFRYESLREPFLAGAADAAVTILDIGAGYGPVSTFILDQYPHATCVAQDSSEPMLKRARYLVAKYGERTPVIVTLAAERTTSHFPYAHGRFQRLPKERDVER